MALLLLFNHDKFFSKKINIFRREIIEGYRLTQWWISGDILNQMKSNNYHWLSRNLNILFFSDVILIGTENSKLKFESMNITVDFNKIQNADLSMNLWLSDKLKLKSLYQYQSGKFSIFNESDIWRITTS